MRKLFSILGLVLTCVLAQAAAVNWTNYVPNIQVATNANVANQLQLGTTFTDGHLWPNAPDGTTPWYLEHTVPHTGGNLFQLVDPLGPYFAIIWLWEIQGADLLLTGSAQVQGTVRANDFVGTNAATINNLVATNGVVTGGLTNSGVTVHTPTAIQTLAAGTVIAWDSSTERVVSSGGAVTLTGTPTIQTNNVPDGALITVRGTSDANTVTLQDYRLLTGTCVALEMGNVTLMNGSEIRFQWSAANQKWQQVAFSANSSQNHKFANLTVQTNATVGGTGGGSLIVTNGATTTIPLVVNQAASGSVDMFQVNGGGSNWFKVNSLGQSLTSAGLVGAPSISFIGDPNTGFYNENADRIAMTLGGTAQVLWYANAMRLGSTEILGWSSGSPTSTAADVVLGRDTTSVLQQGSDAVAPTSETFKGPDGLGSDKPGGDMTFGGGKSTGTGKGGTLYHDTSLTAEATGSTANSFQHRYAAPASYVTLTHATATEIAKFSLAANKVLGGQIVSTVWATNSTPHLQAITSTVTFQAVAVSTTITGTISSVDGPQAADSGTLTLTGYTLVDNGDNTFSIKVNVSSDLSSPTERCRRVVTALNGSDTVTATF